MVEAGAVWKQVRQVKIKCFGVQTDRCNFSTGTQRVDFRVRATRF